jgi:hypothetical protein
MRIISLSVLLQIANLANAQVDFIGCATEAPSIRWESVLQGLIKKPLAENKHGKTMTSHYVIPVVFHVIHGGEPVGAYPNILQQQIASQVTIINQDFSGNGYNAANYPAAAFVNWANNQKIPLANIDQNGRIKIADFNIEFCLATIDNNGNSLTEPGINRINYLQEGWVNPNKFSTQATMKSYLDSIIKPQSIWDVKKYLNVWITDKSTLLNYAGVSSVPPLSGLPDLPGNATESTDGIWCFTKAVGSYTLFPAGTYVSTFIDGRTLTHEIGHYLGLRHIWGDLACGNDFCDDTPPASAENTGTPVYPLNAGSCASPSNNPDGEMFMNFMDYTRGPSKYMFTTDQKTRAQTVMLNSPFRNQLGTHNLCGTINSTNDVIGPNPIAVFPNPSNNHIQIGAGKQQILRIKILDRTGLIVKETTSSSISVQELPAGVYFVLVEGVNQNFSTKLLVSHH